MPSALRRWRPVLKPTRCAMCICCLRYARPLHLLHSVDLIYSSPVPSCFLRGKSGRQQHCGKKPQRVQKASSQGSGRVTLSCGLAILVPPIGISQDMVPASNAPFGKRRHRVPPIERGPSSKQRKGRYMPIPEIQPHPINGLHLRFLGYLGCPDLINGGRDARSSAPVPAEKATTCGDTTL